MTSKRTRARALPVLALLLCASAPAAAQDSGAWQTFLRPYDYVQMLAEGDTVWCATGQAGLLLFHPSDGTFSSITRVPGGLAGNALTSIARDLGGDLWFGTDGQGVSRLGSDRRTWGLVNAFDGLRSEVVGCLAVDPQRDSVWIGTEAGIALWNGQEIAGTLPDGVNPSPFASDVITGIVVKSDSQFVATEAGAYLRRPLGGGSVIDTINAGLSSLALRSMVTNGVDVFAHISGAVQRWNGPTRSWFGTAGIGTVHRLQAAAGQVFASSSQGVYRWTGSTWALVDGTLTSNSGAGGAFGVTTPAPGGPIYAANLNGVHTVPAGGGLAVLRRPLSPPGNNVLNLIVEGPRLYVNTLTEGIGRFDGTQWRNWLPGACQAGCDTTFLNPVVPFALVADTDGRKWTACWGIGMEIFDDNGPVPQFTRPTWNDGISFGQHTYAAAAVIDSTGGHWFGMDTPDLGGTIPIGLEHYDSTGAYAGNYQAGQAGQTNMRGNGKIKALTVDESGRIWVGHAGQGLQYFTWTDTTTAARFSTVIGAENLDFRGLVAAGDTIWASTTNDVRAYNRISANLIGSYTIPAGPAQLALHPIAVATNGRVWLGTTNGVRVYNRNGSTVADYTTRNSPLAGDEIRAIRVDPLTGAVWIGTANGLNRFDPLYVPPPPPVLARLEVRAFPNPATLNGIGTTVRLSGNAGTYAGAIYDLSGRVLRRFSGAADRSVIWDGRDADGVIVRPGVYFLRVEAGGRATTARIVLLR
jgi:hypothetical protein